MEDKREVKTKPGPIRAADSHSRRSAVRYCYNCSRKGHFGYECSERRMHGSMFPTSPFIYCYDNEHEIKKRANRLKRKIAELQEASLLPEQPPVPWQHEKHGEYHHKKKSKHQKEHGKHKGDGEHHKKMRIFRAKKPREEKCRSGAEFDHGLEEDFPRGCKRQAWKGSKIRHMSIFQAFPGNKTVYAQETLEGTRRKKKRKKQKHASADIDENLFLIKQRRKSSKRKSW